MTAAHTNNPEFSPDRPLEEPADVAAERDKLERMRQPQSLNAKAEAALTGAERQHYAQTGDIDVQETAERRIEQTMPAGRSARLEPRRLPWWMVVIPPGVFVVIVGIAVLLVAGPNAAAVAVLVAVPFAILSSWPLAYAIRGRQRDKASVRAAVQDAEVVQH